MFDTDWEFGAFVRFGDWPKRRRTLWDELVEAHRRAEESYFERPEPPKKEDPRNLLKKDKDTE